MKRKFPGKNVWKFEYTSRGMQIRNFLFSASSFDRDHTKLAISSNYDGGAYSKMD